MNKEDALRKLDSLEKEAKELRVIINQADKPKPVIERIKSFEDAMNELGTNDEEVRLYNTMKAVGMPKHVVAEQRIVVFCKAMNEGKKHDWNNSSEYKYAPYFDMRKKPNFGFDFAAPPPISRWQAMVDAHEADMATEAAAEATASLL